MKQSKYVKKAADKAVAKAAENEADKIQAVLRSGVNPTPPRVKPQMVKVSATQLLVPHLSSKKTPTPKEKPKSKPPKVKLTTETRTKTDPRC